MVVTLRRIKAKETASLRQLVLRPHQAIEEMTYPNDEHEGAVHIGAFEGETLVGIVSIYPETEDGRTDQNKVWRLRGMATSEAVRGKGYGKKLLVSAIKTAKELGGQRLWCNARMSASRFYEKNDFQKREGPFEIEGIGPHFYMWVSLT